MLRALMQTPKFWYTPQGIGYVYMALLWPFSLLFNLGARLKKALTKPKKVPVSIICVGNLTAGGSGKTPIVKALAMHLTQQGEKVAILSRGYGRQNNVPLLVDASHSYRDVGDEPLEIFQAGVAAYVLVGADRLALAGRAASLGATIAIMDDGFSHHRLSKDIHILVTDAKVGLGNKLCLPAGPLREPLSALGRADMVVRVAGSGFTGQKAGVDTQAPVIDIQTITSLPQVLSGLDLFAFCGLGLPDKFFASVKAAGQKMGCEVKQTKAFPDHHPYSQKDLQGLKDISMPNKYKLVTTYKDFLRLPQWQGVHVATLSVDAESCQQLFAAVDKKLSTILPVVPKKRQGVEKK